MFFASPENLSKLRYALLHFKRRYTNWGMAFELEGKRNKVYFSQFCPIAMYNINRNAFIFIIEKLF